jgi:uncharacterized protein (UPF0218 family)
MKHLIFSALYVSKEMSTMPTEQTPVNSSHLPNIDKKGIRFLPNELRKELKEPQGLLIEGPFEKTLLELKELIQKEKPLTIISVGDIVSQRMVEYGLYLKVMIVDNKTMRKPIQPIKVHADHTMYAKNPPGSITDESWTIIRQALVLDGQTKVIIEGEEDLLTLVAVLSAPLKAFVIYGQPNVGIVVIKVTEKVRKKMRVIIDSMKETSKT